MTMMMSRSSAITQLTLEGSALGGYPVEASAALYLASSQPRNSMFPKRVTTSLPGSAGTEVNDNPAFPRKSFALSQALSRDQGPMKMWKLQSLAATVMGVASWYLSSPGLM